MKQVPPLARIREIAARYGVDEHEAAFMLDLAEGKTRGDLGGPEGLTDDERAQLGLEPWPIQAPAASPRR